MNEFNTDFDSGNDYSEPGSFAAPGSRVPVRGLSRPQGRRGFLLRGFLPHRQHGSASVA